MSVGTIEAPLALVTARIGEINAHRGLVNIRMVHLFQQSARIVTLVPVRATRGWLPFVASLRFHMWAGFLGIEIVGIIARIPSFFALVVPPGTRHLVWTIPSSRTRVALVRVHKELDVHIARRKRRLPRVF